MATGGTSMPRGLATSVSSPGGFYGWTRHTEDLGEDAAPVHENSDITKNPKIKSSVMRQRLSVWVCGPYGGMDGLQWVIAGPT